jgi:hypothetical protein
MEKELYEFTRNYLITSHCEICSTIIVSLFIHFLSMYYRGHPKVNVFFYSLIFTLNYRRPKMSKFDTNDKKFIETIFFLMPHLSDADS